MGEYGKVQEDNEQEEDQPVENEDGEGEVEEESEGSLCSEPESSGSGTEEEYCCPALSILDPSLVPDDPMNEEYGCAEVQCLATQHGGAVNGIVDHVALDDEWLSLRTYMRRGKGHLSQEQLVRSLLTDATLALLYPNMRLLASVLMVIPVSTADSERSFSTLKRIKTRLRSRLSNAVLNDLLTISIDGPHVNDFDFARAVTKWAGLKNRRISV
ncbi:uncharacterized protein LOC118407347 [Branchiostoma floridae]|uniref:Uncharacterized protein LOC118407347 n=1 Tax=Branchiostoma floridae TaxID=7739 RepID=A0A9J7HTB9_BRAFL|nr:uncharacterized protein LOC118407347 [Branchiostoma floridae]